jgi:hypothetical protein
MILQLGAGSLGALDLEKQLRINPSLLGNKRVLLIPSCYNLDSPALLRGNPVISVTGESNLLRPAPLVH